MMKNRKISVTEKGVLLMVAIIVATGFILFYTNRESFTTYVVEDGLVEWLTVAGLLMGSVVCFIRFIALFRKKWWWFLTVNLLLGLMLFMVAGEEISWGQRILGIQSSEYFKENNLQGETNLHNLMIGGVKINQVVFSLGLIVALSVYLVFFPVFYRRSKGFKRWIDSWGIVLPQTYQIVAFLLLFGITALLHHEKNAELLECGAGLLFFLIVRYPLNPYIFSQQKSSAD